MRLENWGFSLFSPGERERGNCKGIDKKKKKRKEKKKKRLL